MHKSMLVFYLLSIFSPKTTPTTTLATYVRPPTPNVTKKPITTKTN